jgi:hypothetical protein
MKNLLLPCFLIATFFAGFTGLAKNANAQSTPTLIHYWYFPEFATVTYSVPNVPFIYEDYDVSGDTSSAYLEYYLIPGTSSSFGSGNTTDQLDGVACVDSSVADGGNARNGIGPNGWALRVRNPVDSIELRWHMPTTGYSNPVITYALESSSTKSGDSTQVFSYSNNGGASWNTAAIWVNGADVDTLSVANNAIYQGSSWGLVVITFDGDDSVNNNPNFIFRITYRGNTALESGNNRFADVTMDAGGAGGSKPPPAKVTVSAPASGNILVPGQQATITFATENIVNQACTIQFSSNGGTSWSPVGQVTSGTSYVWTVPDVSTENGEIEVTDSGVSGVSTPFVIYPITPSNLIVHYWDFNTLTQAYHLPNIPNLPADFSATTPGGAIQYVLNGLSTSDSGYIDNVAGDTASADALFGEPAGQALRVRNPTWGMYLDFVIPTTGYQGITLKYALQSSSTAAPQVETFSYSTNGGAFFVSTGITVNGVAQNTLDVLQSQYQAASDGVFAPVTIGFPGQTSMDNNAGFIFRIAFSDDSTQSSGNNRIDNFTVTATTQLPHSGVNEPAQVGNQLQIAPNPASDYISFENPYSTSVTVSVLNVLGQEVLHSDNNASMNVELNTSSLPEGTYYIHVQNVSTGASQIAKFVKQ